MKAYRQGDVVIKPGKVPAGVNVLSHRILALGEVTGHKHQITIGEATLYDHEGTLFLRVESDTATLTHEEHGPIVLPKGDFEITIQREYEPSGWRNVSD